MGSAGRRRCASSNASVDNQALAQASSRYAKANCCVTRHLRPALTSSSEPSEPPSGLLVRRHDSWRDSRADVVIADALDAHQHAKTANSFDARVYVGLSTSESDTITISYFETERFVSELDDHSQQHSPRHSRRSSVGPQSYWWAAANRFFVKQR